MDSGEPLLSLFPVFTREAGATSPSATWQPIMVHVRSRWKTRTDNVEVSNRTPPLSFFHTRNRGYVTVGDIFTNNGQRRTRGRRATDNDQVSSIPPPLPLSYLHTRSRGHVATNDRRTMICDNTQVSNITPPPPFLSFFYTKAGATSLTMDVISCRRLGTSTDVPHCPDSDDACRRHCLHDLR